MEELETLQDLNVMYGVAGLFALLELARWLYSLKDFVLKTVGIKTKGMLEREERERRLRNTEKAIEEIKENSKRNVEMFLDHEQQVVTKFVEIKKELLTEFDKLHEKVKENQEELYRFNETNKQTDCVILRDRIANSMRHFNRNKDSAGVVHISLSDHENMELLFKEYFAKGGNGTFEQMYENEFKHFIIDN